MSHKDILHQTVISELLEGKISVGEAAQKGNLSIRQVHRLRKKAKEEGIESIRHGNLGRKPIHAVDAALEEQIAGMYRDSYQEYNFTHFCDIIYQEGNCSLSRSTIYRILRAAGFSTEGKPKRTKVER